MVASYLRFFIPFFFAFYVSGFTVIGPLSADVDRFNNVPAYWTWSEGDPTKIVVHLFVHTSDDVCVFGKANPVKAMGIQGNIQSAREVDGKKNGTVLYQADKIGEYILCAYEDVTNPGGKLNLTSIANSSVFSVSRPPIVQTATLLGSSSSLEPTASISTSNEPAGAGSASSQNKSNLSGGVIAGAVIGGICLAGLLVAVFVVYRRMRYRRRVIAFHKERMAITPPLSNFGSADMTEKGFSIRTISSFGDGHPKSPQSFSTQNTLQPLRRPPV